MTEIRLLDAVAGEAKRFSVRKGAEEVASVATKKLMTVEQVRALFAPEKPAGIDDNAGLPTGTSED